MRNIMNILTLMMLASLSGCGENTPVWTEVRDCTEVEMATIEVAIEKARGVRMDAEAEYYANYEGVVRLDFDAVWDELDSARFKCGIAELRNSTEDSVVPAAAAVYATNTIKVNVESAKFQLAQEYFDYEYYGSMTDPKKLAVMYDWYEVESASEGVLDLTFRASRFQKQPGELGASLIHEAVHLLLGHNESRHDYDATHVAAGDEHWDDECWVAGTAFESQMEAVFEAEQDHLWGLYGTVDWDGDGYTVEEGDCVEENDAWGPDAYDYPGDGVDRDCDGLD